LKLQTNFRDYYDGCLRHGVDEQVIYRRFSSEVLLHELSDKTRTSLLSPRLLKVHTLEWSLATPFPDLRNHPDSLGCFGSARVLVGFCGKIWSYFVARMNLREDQILTRDSVPCPTVAKVDEVVATLSKNIQDGYNNPRPTGSFSYAGNSKFARVNLVSQNYPPVRESIDVFQELGCPTFLAVAGEDPRLGYPNLLGMRIIRNPNLGELGFASILDPYTAFQELSMFVGGVLTQQTMPPQVTDDVVLRDKKGFDDRSFKRDSPGKKAKRRGKR
jgi:hypothetical protein